MSDTQTSAHTLTSMHECLKSLTHTYALCRCRNEGTSLQTLTLPAKCCALSEAAITESLSFLVRLCHSKLFSENICMWIQLFVPSRLCFFLYLFKSFSVECAITGCKIFFALFFLFAGRHYVLRTVGVGVRGVWCRGGQVIVVQAERERDGQSVQTRLALNTPNYISINLQRWRLIWQWPICSSGCISGSYPGRWQDGD